MLKSLLLGATPTRREDIHYDDVDDKFHLSYSEDIEGFKSGTAALRHEADIGNKGYSPSREFRRVASIPPVVVVHWLNHGIDVFNEDDWPKIAAMLDSNEYSCLRTAPL